MADIAATHTTGKDDWETPWWLVNLLVEEFGVMDLDPCCTLSSKKGVEYFTEEDNGLAHPWWGNVFVNPPYSQMGKWAEKAHTEAALGNTEKIFFLCAARTDTRAWWNFLRHGEVRFIKGRIHFIDPNREKTVGAPFPSALVIFSHRLTRSSTKYWDIPKEVRK